MSWKETNSRRFVRPLDSIELYFKALGEKGATFNRENGAVRAYAKFSRDPSGGNAEAALKHAWKTVRYLQPQIAATLQGETIVYEVPQAADLESWMAKTFLIETMLSVDELLASPRRSSLPTLHYLPKTSEVLICASHWRIDAIGATALMNLLFRSFAKPPHTSFGDEGKNLLPGRDEAARLFQTVSQESEDAATSLLMEYTTNIPGLGLPVELVNEMSGAICRIESRLSPATTKSVISACKARDLSVTTAVHAALIVALQLLSTDKASAERYTSWGTFNYRPHVDPDYTDPARHPVSVMLCSLPITLPTSDFHENASSLKPFYKQLDNPFNSAALHAMLAPYTRKCAALINQPLPRGIPQSTEPLVNSIGILDRYLDGKYGQGAVEIVDFWLGGVVLTRQPQFYVWTWQGRMNLSICYNEQYYTAAFVRSFIESVEGVLLRELGIEHG